jgi:hypothetical protein
VSTSYIANDLTVQAPGKSPGTPHCYGAKSAVGLLRTALRALAVVLVESSWVKNH